MIISAKQARELSKESSQIMEQIKEAIRWRSTSVVLVRPLSEKDVDFLTKLGYTIIQPSEGSRGSVSW